MNNKLVNEFNKLLDYTNIQIQELKKINDEESKKKLKGNQFRAKQIANVIKVLNNYPDKITLKNYNELESIPGIGKNTINRRINQKYNFKF